MKSTMVLASLKNLSSKLSHTKIKRTTTRGRFGKGKKFGKVEDCIFVLNMFTKVIGEMMNSMAKV